jgi:hypothetical protein
MNYIWVRIFQDFSKALIKETLSGQFKTNYTKYIFIN